MPWSFRNLYGETGAGHPFEFCEGSWSPGIATRLRVADPCIARTQLDFLASEWGVEERGSVIIRRMPGRRAICLIVDGLRASALGAYGGLGIATPALDQLASRSVVADWMWTAGPTIDSFYAAIATGQHSLRGAVRRGDDGGVDLFAKLAAAGIRLDLVTDDSVVANRFDATGHVEVTLLDLPTDELAASVEATRFAQVLAIGAEQWLAAGDETEDRLLWIHAAGWHGPWDAPLAIRESLLAEDELTPSAAVNLSTVLDSDDPDELLIARTAYAAQTAVLDECMEGFLAAVGGEQLDEGPLLIFGGARGMALGEHGYCGPQARPCYSEFLHIPLLVCPSLAGLQLERDRGFRSPGDITATLLQWFGVGGVEDRLDGEGMITTSDQAAAIGRGWNVCVGEGDLALRTAAWMLRAGGYDEAGEARDVELYVKPDDRWEANEVADRCPGVVEAALGLLLKLREADRVGGSIGCVEVPEILVDARR